VILLEKLFRIEKMDIILPLDSDDPQTAQLTKLDEIKFWGFMRIEEGHLVEIDFYNTREEIEAYPECVIVENKDEYVWPFMEEGLGILIAPVQRSIDEIVEAYLFRELHEING
jgi:hypothetical protein